MLKLGTDGSIRRPSTSVEARKSGISAGAAGRPAKASGGDRRDRPFDRCIGVCLP
jgi:hypothetical protein